MRPSLMFSLFSKDKPSLLDRLKQSVAKTRSEISSRVEGLFGGDRRLDAEQLRRLENALLAADLGVRTTRELIDSAREAMNRTAPSDSTDLRDILKKHLLTIL